MQIADQVRKRGFRRWHERQLVEAHASLVTALLCLIVLAVCVDQLHWREAGFKPLIMLALIVASLLLCFKTVTFYFKVLFRAEHYAAQAVCSKCKTYGVIAVTGSSTTNLHNAAAATADDWIKVRCKKCGHAWTMSAEHEPPPIGKPL
jgi:phage FluMu protein Com